MIFPTMHSIDATQAMHHLQQADAQGGRAACPGH